MLFPNFLLICLGLVNSRFMNQFVIIMLPGNTGLIAPIAIRFFNAPDSLDGLCELALHNCFVHFREIEHPLGGAGYADINALDYEHVFAQHIGLFQFKVLDPVDYQLFWLDKGFSAGQAYPDKVFLCLFYALCAYIDIRILINFHIMLRVLVSTDIAQPDFPVFHNGTSRPTLLSEQGNNPLTGNPGLTRIPVH